MHWRSVAMAMLLPLLASAPRQTAEAQAVAGDMKTRALIVVIWERRAPRTVQIAGRYGQVQKRNREALLSLLYGGPKPLIADPASTVLAIYPEGSESFAQQPDRIRRMETMTPDQLWRSELPRFVATAGAYGNTRAIFHPAAIPRDSLDTEIRQRITYPLVGMAPSLAGLASIDESRQRGANPSAARAVSNPPLVTAWALQDAARRAGVQDELLSPVYAIWVHAGERNYAITNPRQRILDDYGVGARNLYAQTLELYSLLRDEAHGVDGELAEGNVVVWRVLPRHAVSEPPQAAILTGRMPASFSWDASGIWANPVSGDQGISTALRRSVASMHWPRWSYRVESPGYTVADGRFRFLRSGATAPIASDGSIPGGLRAFVQRAFPVSGTSWDVDDDVIAETLLEPKVDERVPPYLAATALRIPVRHRTRPASVSIHMTSLHPGILWLGALAIVAGIVFFYVRLRHRFATRALFATVEFGNEREEVVIQGPATTALTEARVMLLDRSGFLPRRVRVPLSIEITEPQGDVVLTGQRALYSFEQPVNRTAPRKARLRIETRRRPSMPSKASPMPLQIRMHANALDYSRLTAGQELSGVYTLAVAAVDESGAYEPFRQEFGRRFRLQIEAATPQYEVEIIPSEPVLRLGFFGDPEADRESLERPFGRLVVRNPLLAKAVALDIDVAVLETDCRVAERNGAAIEHFLHPNRESAGSGVVWSKEHDTAFTVRNNGAAVYDIFLRLPHGTEWKSRDKWTIRFTAKLAISWTGSPADQKESYSKKVSWMPVAARSFVCLDLGTSATRLLVQGQPDERFGYMKFPADVLPYGWSPEDLPSTAWIDPDRREVRFGTQALRAAMDGDSSAKLHPSLKELMLSGSPDYADLVQLYIERFLTELYKPAIHDSDRNRPSVDVINPLKSGRPEISRGPRHVLIGTVPNEASRELVKTYEQAIEGSGLFRRFLVMREAEAAAFGYIHDTAARRPHGDHAIKVLVVDVGAGSTDLALIESTPKELKVLSRAGVQVAGNHIDRAILRVLPEATAVSPMELAATTPDAEIRLLDQARTLKAAMSSRQSDVPFDAGHTLYTITARELDAIYRSEEYQQAMREVIEEPLLMLLGRAPEAAMFKEIDVLLLTGRGALMRGVREHVDEALGIVNITPRHVAFEKGHNGTLLKAAVTMGARVFGLGPWPSMTLSTDTFPDRVVFVAATAKGPRAVEVIPAGQRFNRGAVLGRADIPFREWSDAVLIRTCLRTDGAFGPDVELTAERMEAVLRRNPIDGLRMDAYRRIDEEMPHRTKADAPASLAVGVNVNERFECRWTETKTTRRSSR
jgi:actin-like ATPase involved in cell morphogenesis